MEKHGEGDERFALGATSEGNRVALPLFLGSMGVSIVGMAAATWGLLAGVTATYLLLRKDLELNDKIIAIQEELMAEQRRTNWLLQEQIDALRTENATGEEGLEPREETLNQN